VPPTDASGWLICLNINHSASTNLDTSLYGVHCRYTKWNSIKFVNLYWRLVWIFFLKHTSNISWFFTKETKVLPYLPSSTLLVTECLFQLTFLGPLFFPSEILIQGLTVSFAALFGL